jgi:RHS repeat-associated protein
MAPGARVDARNRRVGKKVDDEFVKGWLYQDQLEPVAELDASGAVVAEFVYGSRAHVPDYMLKYVSGQWRTYRFVTDHLGSVRMVLDTANGNVAQRIDYDEWGRATLVTGTWDVQPFGFAGGLYDPDTGLVRFGARDYDPETGRWTAKDPVWFNGASVNLFTYAFNDPINSIDINGMKVYLCRSWYTPHPTIQIDSSRFPMFNNFQFGFGARDLLSGLCSPFFWVPGVVLPEEVEGIPSECSVVYDTDDWDLDVWNSIMTDLSNPPDYHGVWYNCIDWVIDKMPPNINSSLYRPLAVQ